MDVRERMEVEVEVDVHGVDVRGDKGQRQNNVAMEMRMTF